MIRFLRFAGLLLATIFHAIILATVTAVRFTLALFDWIVSAAVLLFILAAPAYAAAAAPAPDTLLNIPQATWTEINQLLVGIFLALGALAWKWLDAHSPLKNTQAEELARNAFSLLLDRGAQFGMTQINAAEQRVGTIDVGNAAVAAGANFVLAQGPKLAKSLGFDVTTDDGRAAIVRSVTLRVGTMMAEGDKLGTAKPAPASLPLAPAIVTAGSPTPSTLTALPQSPVPTARDK